MQTHRGSCHCGHLTFSVQLDLAKGVSRCNCSICTKTAITGAIVKPAAFTALTDEAALATYAWASKTGTRYFCPRCGVHGYGRGHLPQLGGDYVSINANCLDGIELSGLPVAYFDGRHDNWMAGTRPAPWPILG
jgi:hypothetical protein